MLGKRVCGNQFKKKISGGGIPDHGQKAHGLRAFGARGRPAPPTAAPRTSTQSCRKSMPVPSPNRFNPVGAYAYDGALEAA